MTPNPDPTTQAAAALKMALRAVPAIGAPTSSPRTPETAKAGPGSPAQAPGQKRRARTTRPPTSSTMVSRCVEKNRGNVSRCDGENSPDSQPNVDNGCGESDPFVTEGKGRP